jgi:YD repeat-containing protein
MEKQVTLLSIILLAAVLCADSTNLTADTTHYTYDQAGRLIRVDTDTGMRIRYSYDAAGNLLERDIVQTSTVYTLSVANTGAGAGAVTSIPAGIDCGGSCSAGYDSGTQVTLTASPASGSEFAGWSGGCSGTATCVLTMNSNQSVTVVFEKSQSTSGSGGCFISEILR